MSMPWLFLTASLLGLSFTGNALRSVRGIMPLIAPSFFAGWLTAELALHHVLWQGTAALIAIWLGALKASPGWVGLGLCLLSWSGLLFLHTHSVLSASESTVSALPNIMFLILMREKRDGRSVNFVCLVCLADLVYFVLFIWSISPIWSVWSFF